MTLIVARRGRDWEYTITITESDDSEYVYAASDAIRVKIGREGSTPVLDLTSTTPSENASTVSAANPTTLVLRAADMNLLERGIYELEVAVVDDSDNDKIKHAQSHVLCVEDSQAGGVSI